MWGRKVVPAQWEVEGGLFRGFKANKGGCEVQWDQGEGWQFHGKYDEERVTVMQFCLFLMVKIGERYNKLLFSWELFILIVMVFPTFSNVYRLYFL